MLALARALMSEPILLFLDEPSAGLAPAAVDAVFERIIEINRSGVSIVMVEQNARRSLALSTYGYVLDMGRNRFEGPGDELLHDDNVVELYLGGRGRLSATLADDADYEAESY
jgi:neutral amino acid transport system ATP-binding protein